MSRGFLLDTHALIWWLGEAELLTMTSFDVIADRTIDVYVSPVSAMEIATKFRIGKLPSAAPYAGRVAEIAVEEGFALLPLTADHADLAGSFISSNNDPWDRLLAAQARLENLALISNDSKMAEFGISQYW
ncbi:MULTISPECIES: type II toxin-antitoxin system VapC family toxin [unclassified Sphingomonas]|jgi:PIN domain nuclease of toxin-antitoxin system|uniref:type II toxin-antitoxin system VapC family toxin n=1 Tax=unclassified Sphingomonas TaxID=196159 RepID=UPI00083699B8|nr:MULTISPECIES: type II toxin-antitoxin system VapC family toxin [unclassified Sphingomonas]